VVQTKSSGRRIGDRYELNELLGKGGMGRVWRAHDHLLHRDIAVKEVDVQASLTESEAALVKRRALREARSAARLSHPGAVATYDVVDEDDGAFIVMELVEGSTLADVVRNEGPLNPEAAARIGLDVIDTLEAAHDNGVVHRDIKPANIMLPPDGGAKVADFGIASVKDDPKITQTGMVMGSPQFMAPEQAQGERSGPAADVWALGATLYYAVEARFPFDRGNAISTLAAVVQDDYPKPRKAGRLSPAINAALSKDAGARPDDDELRDLLREVIEPTVDFVSPEPVRRSRPKRRRLRWGLQWLAAAVVAGALIGVVATALLPEQEDGRRQPTDRQAGPRAGSGQSQVRIPADWVEHKDPETGYTISYPAGWEQIDQGQVGLDFRDPETGTYLRVAATDTPGPSPVGAWRAQAQDFSASHANYQEIRIDPATYKGYEAAKWEFTYTEGGVDLHALDLGFVTDEYGFALYFQTHAERWDESQTLWVLLKASFKPPAG
jgi:eukaryotic-like serine/threonine-protein kinase